MGSESLDEGLADIAFREAPDRSPAGYEHKPKLGEERALIGRQNKQLVFELAIKDLTVEGIDYSAGLGGGLNEGF